MAKQIQLNYWQKKLHDRALAETRTYKISEARLLVIIEEVDRTRLYEKFLEKSTYYYCFNVLGFTESLSWSFQAVARKTREVPELLSAVQGGLSISSANKLVSQITPVNQSELIEIAKKMPQKKLERELRARNPTKRKRAIRKPVDKTHSRISFDLPHETLADLQRAKELLGGSEAEVFAVALNLLLDRHDPVRKADRAAKREAEKSSARAEKPAASTDGREPRYAAGPQTAKVMGENSARAERVPFDAKTKHALNGRDRGKCQQDMPNGEICGDSALIHFHHKIAVADGGSNEPENLISLCSTHHRMLHRNSVVKSRVVEYMH